MKSCSSSKTLIVKGDRFSKGQCPQNDIERDQMKAVPYYLVVGSLIYAQVCTRLDIVFLLSVCWVGTLVIQIKATRKRLRSFEVSLGYQGSHVDISAYRHS